MDTQTPPPTVQGLVNGLIAAGLKEQDIAAELGCPQSLVNYWRNGKRGTSGIRLRYWQGLQQLAANHLPAVA